MGATQTGSYATVGSMKDDAASIRTMISAIAAGTLNHVPSLKRHRKGKQKEKKKNGVANHPLKSLQARNHLPSAKKPSAVLLPIKIQMLAKRPRR